MLAKFINEKLAGKVENKQLFIDGDAEDPKLFHWTWNRKLAFPKKTIYLRMK